MEFYYLVISRASFCCSKKLKKLHLFLTKVAESCINFTPFLMKVAVESSMQITKKLQYKIPINSLEHCTTKVFSI